jgi:hypothetical protein
VDLEGAILTIDAMGTQRVYEKPDQPYNSA